MTKAERIAELAETLEQDTRKATAKDICIDLADSIKTSDPEERAGIQAAIEIIRANYLGAG